MSWTTFQTLKGSLQTFLGVDDKGAPIASFKPSKDRYKLAFSLLASSSNFWFQTLKGSLQTVRRRLLRRGRGQFQTLKGSLQTGFMAIWDHYHHMSFQTLKGSLQTFFPSHSSCTISGFKPSKDRYKLSSIPEVLQKSVGFKPSKDRYKLYSRDKDIMRVYAFQTLKGSLQTEREADLYAYYH